MLASKGSRTTPTRGKLIVFICCQGYCTLVRPVLGASGYLNHETMGHTVRVFDYSESGVTRNPEMLECFAESMVV